MVSDLLPLSLSPTLRPSLDDQPAPFPRPAPRDAQPSEFGATTILFVDDDPDIRSLTRTFLEHIGFRVLISGDADRAAAIFRSVSQVDLLITDFTMPGRSGMELAQELTALRPGLPVLMISGSPLGNTYHSQLSRPGWSFLPKPYALPDLLAAVHNILETH